MAGAAAKTGGLRLFKLMEIDEIDETEQVWIGDFKEFEEVLLKAGKDDEMVQAELHEKCQQPAGHQHMIQALIFGMICDRQRCKEMLRYLTLIVKDNYQHCIKQLLVLAHDKWPKMNDRNATATSQQQMQLLWLVKELVALKVAGIDKVCVSLLRQIQGGNVKSAPNRWLAGVMCSLFQENKLWLKEQVQAESRIIAHVFYTFTRLVADHIDHKFDKMRRQEVQLCCELFQEHFAECSAIGRDVVRALQDVSKVEGFDKLWHALLNNPGKFAGLSDISEVFNVKTNPEFLRSRLTPEMEKQIVFIMQHVKMGQQQRYQRWFMTKWDLSSPEAETLIADLLRFVCGAHHPPNQVIRSDVVQRWAVVGWLLKCVKSPVGLANIKLAIFYDWLFYKEKYDSVMNIEPAALLIWKSTPKWIDITVDLVEFLLAIADKWGGDRYRDRCREGVFNAARDCVKLGVIPTWAVISAYQCRCPPSASGIAACKCAKLSEALRCRVRAQFYTLCPSDDEKPNQEDIKLYSFVANKGPPPGRSPLASPTASAGEGVRGASSPAAISDGDVGVDGRDGEELLLSSDVASTTPPVSPTAQLAEIKGGGTGGESNEDEGAASDDFGDILSGASGAGVVKNAKFGAPLRLLLTALGTDGFGGIEAIRTGVDKVLRGVEEDCGGDDELRTTLNSVAQAVVAVVSSVLTRVPSPYSSFGGIGSISFAGGNLNHNTACHRGTRVMVLLAQLALYIDARAAGMEVVASDVGTATFATFFESLAEQASEPAVWGERADFERFSSCLLLALCSSTLPVTSSSHMGSSTSSTPPPSASAQIVQGTVDVRVEQGVERRLRLYRLVVERDLKRWPEEGGRPSVKGVAGLVAEHVRELVGESDTRLVTDLVSHLLVEFPSLVMDSLEEPAQGGGRFLAMLCAIQIPSSLLHLSTLLSLGRVAIVRCTAEEDWSEAFGKVVKHALQWDAVEAQTLWTLLTAELSCKSSPQVEMGLSKAVELMVAAFDAQPQICHWEAVHACVFALADHNATPRLVYIAAQLSHLLDRLPAGSIHRKTPAAVVCLVRWARANAHELSLSIAHLLLLKPLGEESPDVSIVVMLLHSWLEATSSPPGPEALQAALAKLHQGGRFALRQELSLCDDTTTRALENLLLLIPADGVDSEQGGIEVAGKRGRSADEVTGADPLGGIAATTKRPRRGTS